MKKESVNNIDGYLATFDEHKKKVLNEIRAAISAAAPDAEEKISYGIPTFFQDGNLVHFGGSKNHLGFYPGPGGIRAFEKELAGYTTSKGAIQFPYEKKLPVSLIKKIVKFRLAENKQIASEKKSALKKPGKVAALPSLSKPASNALLNIGVDSLKKLCRFTREEILKLHGMGPASMPVIESALKAAGLKFKK